MNMLRAVTGLVLFAMVGVLAADADGAQKKKKKGGLAGTILSVEAGKEAGEGTITIKTGVKKKDANAQAKEVKIQVKKDTKIEKLIGKQKDKKTEAGAFSDLQKGALVIISLKNGQGDVAEKIMVGKAKKNKAAS